MSAPVDDLLAQAERLYHAGRREEARAAYAEALRLHPNHPVALHALGWLAHEAEDDAAAEEWVAQAVAADPNAPGFHNTLGVVRLARGDAAGAEASFLQLTRLLPEDARGYLNLGHARMRAGRFADAADAYRRAAELQPHWPDAHRALGRALRDAADLPGALAAFRAAARLQPDDPAVHDDLGLTLLKSGHPEQAIGSLRTAITLDPTNAFARCNLGLALEERGDIAGALAAIAEAHRLRPGEPAIAYHFAAISAAAGRAAAETPATCPPDYVAELFDDYAPRFDQHLVGELGYRGHELLFEIVDGQWGSEFGVRSSGLPALDILDLGCGTGLTGVPFEPLARSVTGVDLSQRMLDRAAERRRADGRPLYDRLVRTDVLTALREKGNAYDLILAADLFIYVGRLEDVFPAVATALRPGGVFAFTIELLPNDRGDLRLLPTRRYAQSAAYIERVSRAAGLVELSRREAPLRRGDDGRPVAGLVMLLRRP